MPGDRLVGVEAVLGHRAGTAAAAAKANLPDVEVEVHLRPRDERRAEALLARAVAREVEVLPGVVRTLYRW